MKNQFYIANPIWIELLMANVRVQRCNFEAFCEFQDKTIDEYLLQMKRPYGKLHQSNIRFGSHCSLRGRKHSTKVQRYMQPQRSFQRALCVRGEQVRLPCRRASPLVIHASGPAACMASRPADCVAQRSLREGPPRARRASPLRSSQAAPLPCSVRCAGPPRANQASPLRA